MTLEIKNLSFSYKKGEPVLDKLNMNIPHGAIYGYLGNNGAGKTTTINLILGLLPVNRQTVFYNGNDILNIRDKYAKEIGIVFQPISVYAHLTPIEHLQYVNLFYNVPKCNIEKVLQDVGLYEYRKKKIKSFSAGMKQKFAIAMSLLHEPKFLIMDEPINGLDPNAIIEFRDLIKKINDKGVTILMSSHILAEVEKCCTHIGIINKGQLVLQDSISNIKAQLGRKLIIKTSDIIKTQQVILELGGYCINIENGELNCLFDNNINCSNIVRKLGDELIDIHDISIQRQNLESLYLSITKDGK